MLNVATYPDGTSMYPEKYDNYEASLTDVSNWGIKANGSGMSEIGVAHYAEIRTTSTITVKINSTSADGITIASTDSPYVIDNMSIREIYITNTGAASVKIRTC